MQQKHLLKILLSAIVIVVVILIAFHLTGLKPGKEAVPVSISSESIAEDTFTGTRPVIQGESAVATAARAFVDDTVATFKAAANEQVPEMRAQFGADAPPAHYELDLEATYVTGRTTESIVITEYAYTGGANGMSLYRVFTAKKGSDEIILIRDAIRPEEQDAFVALVKQELLAWRPGDATEPVVSPEYVDELTIDSLSDWSLDESSMTIYFDKYEVGAGALGAVALPIDTEKVKAFLTFDP